VTTAKFKSYIFYVGLLLAQYCERVYSRDVDQSVSLLIVKLKGRYFDTIEVTEEESQEVLNSL
jgi:hypothetical protein